MSEVQQQLRGANNVTIVWRLRVGEPSFVEVDITFGIVEINWDYVIRFNSDVASNGTFFSDDNGLVIMQRSTNSSDSVQSNYFPQTEVASVASDSAALSIVTSQSHGVSSRAPGSLEFMVFRRLLNPGIPSKG